MSSVRASGGDKRRMILDAAVVVFARRGFHACRVSDIADEANVAYGLVYHYFRSKDEILDTLFLDRWNILLDVISRTDEQQIPLREKLHALTSYIIDSYRHNPDLTKVIIVEVTRAANSFGRTHRGKIRELYALIADMVAKAQADGAIKREVTPAFAALAIYGAIEQVLTGWIFEMLPHGEAEFDMTPARIVDTICGGIEAHPATAPASARAV
ncbi:MAG: TetR/AcrR family transcriptional regulator [Solirubrobacteraceae bacterium]